MVLIYYKMYYTFVFKIIKLSLMLKTSKEKLSYQIFILGKF